MGECRKTPIVGLLDESMYNPFRMKSWAKHRFVVRCGLEKEKSSPEGVHPKDPTVTIQHVKLQPDWQNALNALSGLMWPRCRPGT